MGSGKTSWAIEYIRSNPQEKFLYITPFLTEIIRIKQATSAKEPSGEKQTKIADMKSLLEENTRIIACTHELFIRFTDNIRELIVTGEYIIIMDEALQAISVYQSSWHNRGSINEYDPYNAPDSDCDNIRYLFEKGSIDIDDDDYVDWVEQDEKINNLENTFYREIRSLAQEGRLLYVDMKYPIVVYPPEIFRQCKKVYIMTYLFEASIMYYYMKIFKISFLKKSIDDTDGKYRLVNYYTPNTSKYQNMIQIIDNSEFSKPMKYLKDNAFSSTWSKNARKNNPRGEALHRIRKNYYNCIVNRWNTNESSGEVIWTCIGKNAKKLIERSGIKNCFVSVNCRATNDYTNVQYMGYFANIYMHVPVKKYIESRGLSVDEKLYALSEMLQFIWRGCIRRNRLLTVYIPSPRMRKILCEWLGCEYIPDQSKTKVKLNT